MARARIKPVAGRQAGYLLAALAVFMVMTAAVIASYLLSAATSRAKREGTSQLEQLSYIENAIAAFVTANKRLPCPADGSLPSSNANAGLELRDSGICSSPDAAVNNQKTGVVPWKTLALTEQQVRSEDATFFSYRVFSGPKGFTFDSGADMTHCDTDNGITADATLPANGQCTVTTVPKDHNNTVAQFIADKGLSVITDSGTVTAAYVLIHHGANGRGAFLSSGIRNPIPPISATKEYANVQGTDGGTYTATYYATSANTSAANDSADFLDDRVVAPTIAEIAKKAGLNARNWPEAGDIIDAANLAEAGFDLATQFQTFGTATIGGVTYQASSRLTIDTDTGNPTAIGVGTSSAPIDGANWLSISFPTDIQKFSIILSQFGFKTSGGSAGKPEAATLELRDATDTLVATVKLVSCGTTLDVSTNVIAFDNVMAGMNFRKIVLRPGFAGDPAVANASDTNFYLNGVAPCSATATSCLPVGAGYSQSCSYTFTVP